MGCRVSSGGWTEDRLEDEKATWRQSVPQNSATGRAPQWTHFLAYQAACSLWVSAEAPVESPVVSHVVTELHSRPQYPATTTECHT
ncbi:hypothetical protein AGIG_G6486 [Arapaima gigas]